MNSDQTEAALSIAPGSQATAFADLDRDLRCLADSRAHWVGTTVAERIAILGEIKGAVMSVAHGWVEAAAKSKGIAAGTALEGEEWLAGPYALMVYCNQMMRTLSHVEGARHLDQVPMRELANGQLVARVLPNSVWDHVLLSGIKADVWMEPGVTRANIRQHTAATYDPASPRHKTGKVALVLGAGNVAAIAPLDVLHKLIAENEVVILKLNPINDYLAAFLQTALKSLVDRGVLRIVRGGKEIGEFLCNHPLVETIHITGAGATHDAIVWGAGAEGLASKAAGTPRNTRAITSELGAVCPTIVVPGPWSAADIAFQAEQVATQKLHNAGFNCVACQVLVVSRDWRQKAAFMSALERIFAHAAGRSLYYPGAAERLAAFSANNTNVRSVPCTGSGEVLIASLNGQSSATVRTVEVFAPALGFAELAGADPELFLQDAIRFANEELYGTLGANIVIHPATIARIGRKRFEELLIGLRYGTIAVNTWTGVGFLTPQATWGAFPGHTLDDVQSGIGMVHNTCLFDRAQRTVVEAPFRPFPRSLLSLSFALLPRPPWFITHRRGRTLGRLLVAFQYRPGWLKIPRIFLNALLG